jgi:hypothetical protein
MARPSPADRTPSLEPHLAHTGQALDARPPSRWICAAHPDVVKRDRDRHRAVVGGPPCHAELDDVAADSGSITPRGNNVSVEGGWPRQNFPGLAV